MAEYYEPMLYMSTPESPNTMGAIVVLKEPVDGEILRDVVGELRERFPYFYVRAVKSGDDMVTEPNPLPMIVRNTWDPITFHSEESNYHLAAFKYEGNRLAFEISHALSDGAGMLPFIKSVMYLYLSRKTGRTFDPAGFRLPGDVIPESETGNPFADLDIDAAEEPMYVKETAADFYRLGEGQDTDGRVFYLKMPQSQLMQYCRDNDGSPNVFFSVMLAKAVRSYAPDSDKTVSVAVAFDLKAMLGKTGNYRMFVNTVELDFPPDRELDDVAKACTIARGQVMLQSQPENALWLLRQKKLTRAKMDQMPLEMRIGIMGKVSGAPRWSFSVSYANSRSFGPLDPYISELYLISNPGVTDILGEISCINDSFFLTISQTFSSRKFLDVFLNELRLVGIDCEVRGTEPLRLCGIRKFS